MAVLPIASPDDLATRYLNRELSWLDFHARVLALAEDAGRPILARVKYLAICSPRGLEAERLISPLVISRTPLPTPDRARSLGSDGVNGTPLCSVTIGY